MRPMIAVAKPTVSLFIGFHLLFYELSIPRKDVEVKHFHQIKRSYFLELSAIAGGSICCVGDERVAKCKYEYWLTADGLTLLEGWARDGLTDEQISSNMGIVPSTLYVWKKDHREISEALKKGKEVVDYEVENALLKNAMDGDTTAQIFWLKNRKPDKWRDKPAELIGEKQKNNLFDAITESLQEDVGTDDLPEIE